MDIREITDRSAWEAVVEELGAHPLQSWQWGSLKQHTGPWEARRLLCVEGERVVGGAQVLVRALPVPLLQLAYVPRGPFAAPKDADRLAEVADTLADWCKHSTRAVSVKIEPAVSELDLTDAWRESEHALIAKTATIDLTPSEDEIMKGIPNRKCRQYIRKAARDGVTCRPGTADDLDQILSLYHATAEADGFALHADEFYRAALPELEGVGQLFVSEYEGRMQSFLWNVTTSGTCFELWGAVSDEGKRTRANYLLKWEAIKAAKARGAKLYDMNGLLNDGISDFKMLFSKEPTYWAGTFDKPLSPLYGAMDKALELNRKRNIAQNAQQDRADETEVRTTKPGAHKTVPAAAAVGPQAPANDLPQLRTLRDVMASRTGTNARDWFCVFKARYGMEVVFQTLAKERGAGTVATQLLTCCTAVDPIVAAGLTPVFGEVSDATFALDPEKLTLDGSVRAVMLQHTHGIVDETFDALLAHVAHAAGALLVEDSAHCVARMSRTEGGAPLADVSLHSFGVEKMLPGTYFGGAVYVNPLMENKKLHDALVSALQALSPLPASLDGAARAYRNEVRVLTRVPHGVAAPLRAGLRRAGAFEPAVSESEQRAELPLEPYAPSAWVAERALEALSGLDANESGRRACVDAYIEVFGKAVAEGSLDERILPRDFARLGGQPLLHFPLALESAALSELVRGKVAQKGFYAVPWYRPLLFPGAMDPAAYSWDGSCADMPVCERLSCGAIALPTDIPADGARDIARTVVSLVGPAKPQERAAETQRAGDPGAPSASPAHLRLIHEDADVRERLVPVIVGGDLLAYSYVREFHKEYGVRPIVLSSIDVKMTSSSDLCDYRIVPGMNDERTVVEYLRALGRELEAQGKVGLALGLADWQLRVLSHNKAALEPWYVVPYVDEDLLARVTRKDSFYAICEELGIAHPQTWELDCSADHAPLDARSFPYPLIAKPADSAAWDSCSFAGKRKIYEISEPAELERAYADVCASEYNGKLLVQDFVPGDDDAIRSLTTFSDANGDLRVVAGGRVVLQDHSPLALGNPVCILGEKVDKIIEDARRFLAHVGYCGYANFDIKYDSRDGSYKFFEVNARPGRNTFYVSLGGVPFVRPLVDEFVLGREVPYKEAYAPYLYTIVPPEVVRRSVGAEALRKNVLACYRDGRAQNPLFYAADGAIHRLWSALYTQNQIRKFKRYLWDAQA